MLQVVEALSSPLLRELAALSVLGLVHEKARLACFGVLVAVSASVDGVVDDATVWQVITQGVHVRLVICGLLVEVGALTEALVLWTKS